MANEMRKLEINHVQPLDDNFRQEAMQQGFFGETLHKCIKKYFRNSDAKTALMACKWLGNNETHYENCNDEQDLQLFEDLIKDTLYYIHREIRHQKAEHINNMKGSKKI